MSATVQIFDHENKRVIDFEYKDQDLLFLMRDLVEMAIMGDKVQISFEYDTINAERCRNFLAIAQLYEYTKNK